LPIWSFFVLSADTTVINRLLQIALFLGAFFSFYSKSTGLEFSDYIQPDIEYKYVVYTTPQIREDSIDAAVDQWFVVADRKDCTSAGQPRTYNEYTPNSWNVVVHFVLTTQNCDGSDPGTTIGVHRIPDSNGCNSLDYPHAEDNDFDGVPDHCHVSICDRNGEMFENPGLSTGSGYVCVSVSNGMYTEYCEHQIGNVQNPDGSVGFSIVAPTGESCGGDTQLPHDPWQPYPEDELPDPNDPSNPPSDDGNPDCTPIGGSGLNICNADPNTVCDSSTGVQVCPAGCGTVNGAFVCVRQDGGADAEVEQDTGENQNESSPDDPNTSGDEGTHSRLDGLLQNTDGLEGLLRGIRDGIENIPSGGAGDMPAEEEPNCPAGQFYIGENCITFDKNDQPINSPLDFTQVDIDITAAEIELRQKVNDFKTMVSSKFNLNFTGSAYIPNVQNIKGASVDFGMARIADFLNFNLLGTIIIFAFSLRAMFILIGG